MNSAVMIVNAEPGYPFRSASAALNTYLVECLRRNNYSVRLIDVRQTYVPLTALSALEEISAAGPVDLAVYCDLCHWLEPLRIVNAKRTLVFFHGLVGTPLVWMTQYFGALCCNSQWTLEVLRSIGGYPLWKHGRMLCPGIYQRSHRVRCPLPALDYPDGGMDGDALSDEFHRSLEQDASVIGLDSFGEADDEVHCQLIVAINVVARECGDERTFRLLIQPEKLKKLSLWLDTGHSSEHDALRARLRALGLGLSEIFCPLPTARVRQSDLFRLMRTRRFALMFNKIPESFGLMPLECVLNECPVHANGAGNIRNLLPPSHGITIHDMNPDVELPDWALKTARSIYQHSLDDSSVACSARQAELNRGRQYIRTTFAADAFERDIRDVLRACSVPESVAVPELRLAKGPLVKRWDAGDTGVVCDTGVVELTRCQSERASELLGSTTTELFRAAVDDQDLVSHLWRMGLLTWTAAT